MGTDRDRAEKEIGAREADRQSDMERDRDR